MSVEKKIAKILYVEWGLDSANCTRMANVFGYGDGFITDNDGLVNPIELFNDVNPDGYTDNTPYWLIKIVLDSGNWHALFAQQVKAGDAGSRVINEGDVNDLIDYMKIVCRTNGGGTLTRTYEGGKIRCVGVDEQSTNNEEERSMTELTFKCWGDRTEAIA